MKRILIVFLIGIMNLHLAYAQTNNEFWAEEFLAEVYYGYMTPKSPKVYIEKQTTLPFFLGNTLQRDSILINSYRVPNSIDDDDVFEIKYEGYDNSITWDENAPVFQQSKYKNLIFVDDISKLTKKERKRAGRIQYTKPVLAKSGKYALIVVTYTDDLGKFKKWDRKNPWKIFGRTKGFYTESIYQDIYQLIDNKWVRIEHKYIGGGHS